MRKHDFSNKTKSISTKMTLNNSQKLLAGFLALVLVTGMTSPAFAQLSGNDVVADTTAAAAEVITMPLDISRQCGDVDLVFAIDDTGSMGPAIANVAAGIDAIVDSVEASLIPGADARYSVITFKDDVTVESSLNTNEAVAKGDIAALTAGGGSGLPEASDMAKQTAIDELAAGAQNDAEGNAGTVTGGFNVPWTTAGDATRAIILITDDVPGGFDDATSGTDDTHLSTLGTDAAAKGIKVYDLIVGSTTSDAFYTADASNSGGAFFTLSTDGTGIGERIIEIIVDPAFCAEKMVGGTVGSMSTTSLLVAGAQANMGLWSLALVGIVGAAAAITYKVKSNKTEQ